MNTDDPIRPEANEDYWLVKPRPEYLDPDHPLFGLNFCKPVDHLALARQEYKEKQERIKAMKAHRK